VERDEIIYAFSKLGNEMIFLGNQVAWNENLTILSQEEYEKVQTVINRQIHLNGWFSKVSVCNALVALGKLLTVEELTNWTKKYPFTHSPKRVGVIMAGNLPLVGFHDFLSVILSGNHIVAKMSSDDNTLLPALVELLFKIQPVLEERITLSTGKIGMIDAMIATGSNNSMNYFESYFGKYPHIFRKNRTSIAILDGTESEDQLNALGKDIFTYFGLGCRNVSQLLIPTDFDLNRFFGAIVGYSEVVNHHKYANNYDYNKAIHLMNQENILDNGFVLLKESNELFSPLAMLYYTRYQTIDEISDFLRLHAENIQVVIGNQHIPFGEAQSPRLTDYADGVDTMFWLSQLAD
jgi:hypothetical protein